jgi:hypothetical protein
MLHNKLCGAHCHTTSAQHLHASTPLLCSGVGCAAGQPHAAAAELHCTLGGARRLLAGGQRG